MNCWKLFVRLVFIQTNGYSHFYQKYHDSSLLASLFHRFRWSSRCRAYSSNDLVLHVHKFCGSQPNQLCLICHGSPHFWDEFRWEKARSFLCGTVFKSAKVTLHNISTTYLSWIYFLRFCWKIMFRFRSNNFFGLWCVYCPLLINNYARMICCQFSCLVHMRVRLTK